MTTSPQAADIKRRLILDSARRLLVAQGFQDIVLDDVARKAGVAKGTLFLYYKSKDELFTAVFAELVEQLGGELESVANSTQTGSTLLRETVRVVLEHSDRNRDFLSQFGVGRFPACGPRSCDKLMALMGKNIRRIVRILRRCSQDGAIRVQNLDTAAFALFGLCRSAVSHRLITGKEKPLEERAARILELFLYGVSGKPC